MKTYDVYSFGMVASSTLYRIRGSFPEPEGYAEIEDVRYMTGGEAANSSIVLSRLGARVMLDGNWIGADESGKRTKALLANNRVDTSRLPPKEGYSGASEVVFAAQDTRTVFGTYIRLLEDKNWNTPHDTDIRQARAICMDPFFEDASSRVAEVGFRAGIPVVTVDCRYDDPILRHASAVVIAESYIQDMYSERRLEELFQAYQRNCSGLVVFTFGASAVWFARPDEPIKTFQPFSIEPVDTSGGGDSFRAGIVYGFLQEWGDGRMIEFAAAVAALTCTRFPGVLDAPNYEEVDEFMRRTTITVDGPGNQRTAHRPK